MVNIAVSEVHKSKVSENVSKFWIGHRNSIFLRKCTLKAIWAKFAISHHQFSRKLYSWVFNFLFICYRRIFATFFKKIALSLKNFFIYIVKIKNKCKIASN